MIHFYVSYHRCVLMLTPQFFLNWKWIPETAGHSLEEILASAAVLATSAQTTQKRQTTRMHPL